MLIAAGLLDAEHEPAHPAQAGASRQRAGGGLHALGAEQVFYGQRHAFKEAHCALGATLVGSLGHLARALRRLGDEGVERGG